MDRWALRADMNWDGVVSISDVGLWLKWFYFLPGDFVYKTLMKSDVAATFFELSPASYGNEISAVMSFFGWIIFILLAAAAIDS